VSLQNGKRSIVQWNGSRVSLPYGSAIMRRVSVAGWITAHYYGGRFLSTFTTSTVLQSHRVGHSWKT
jgi:hypothetical protein